MTPQDGLLTPQDFARAWGEADLFPFPPSLLEDVAIAEPDKRFLAEAGMPRQAEMPSYRDGFQLLSVGNLTEPYRFDNDNEPHLLDRVGPYRLLGDEGGYIVLDESSGGRVLHSAGKTLLQIQDPTYLRYVNATVSQFAYSLLAVRLWKKEAPLSNVDNFSLDSEEKYQQWEHFKASLIKPLQESLQRIDPSATAHPYGFWPRQILYLLDYPS